jgi:Fungal protein kinase
MAVELLLEGKNVTHRPSHDLESLFYVLVYICTNLGGPGTPRTLEELLDFTSLPIAAWFVPETSFEGLATSKLGLAHAFEKRIVDRFSPYFTDIKPCVMELFRAMYPNGPQVKSALTHDRMIEIFTATLEKLPFIDQHFSERPVKTRKHSLCIYDNCVFISEKRRRTQRNNRSISTSAQSEQVTKKHRARPYRQSTSELHDTATE